MEPQAVQAGAAVVGAVHDLSMWSLFVNADIIVQSIMIGLLGASVWCWTIMIDKGMRLRRLFGRADQFEESFWSGGSLEELYDRIGARPLDPMSSIFVAAMREWRRSAAKNSDRAAMRASLPQRVDRVMQVTLGREMEHLEARMGFLASVGSTAPFIGLFGTVWGILQAFLKLGQPGSAATIQVVGPDIAHALVATAVGLVAAIPAVMAYNKLSSDIDRYAKRLEAFAGEFGAILSRQLEEKA